MIGTPRRPHAMLAVAPATVALLLGASGCTGSLNGSNGLFGVADGGCPDLLPAPATAMDDLARERSTSATAPLGPSTSPLTGLDRRAWPLIVVETPAGQVEHQPTYFEPVVLASGPARVRGDAPTTATVLEGHADGGSLLLEAGVAPFVWAGELLISPVRMVIQPPWTTLRAPHALAPAPTSTPSSTHWRWVEQAP